MKLLKSYFTRKDPNARLIQVGILVLAGAIIFETIAGLAWRIGLSEIAGKMLLVGTVSILFSGATVWLVRKLLVAPLEAQIAEARREVEVAEASAQSKMDFLSRMSHEIRTPLGAIMGFSQLLENAVLTDDERTYLNNINVSGDFMLRILNDILDLSKIEAQGIELEKASFSLHRFTESLKRMMQAEADAKHVTFTSECLCESLAGRTLIGDQHRIKQVLMNLVGNAIKFSENGEVFLKVKSDTYTDAETGADRARVLFEVTDTGIGMSKKQLSRIFQPYSQGSAAVSRKFGGTGLGLTISRQLVEMMGGKLDATSRKGEGSTFSFELEFPVSAAKETAKEITEEAKPVRKAPKAPEPPLLTGDTKKDVKILVAEDEAVNRTLINKFFGVLGYSVEFANDGNACIEKLKSNDNYDAIFLDFHMPHHDGMEIAKRIKNGDFGDQSKQAKLILMSADVFANDQAKENGFDTFISKPIDIDNLSACLDSIVPQSRKKERPLQALIVEDQALNRQMIAQIVRGLGMESSFANDGVECIEYLKAHPKLDLILLDLRMPRMDGWTVARKIRNGEAGVDFSGIPIAVVSAEIQAEETCRKIGINDFISKPFQVSQIRDFVKKVGEGNKVALSR